jgi:hypothetical protein
MALFESGPGSSLLKVETSGGAGVLNLLSG